QPSGDSTHLHSFPTRRSSDLASEAGYEATADHFAYMVCCVCADTDEQAQAVGQHYLWRMGYPLRGPGEYWAPPGYLGQRKPLQPDRKSTRLNSSHVAISYAVF